MAKTMPRASEKTSARGRKKPAATKSGRTQSVLKTGAKSSGSRWPKQTFTVSHLDESRYKKGLRSYAEYRDLGVAKATKGAVVAHVIRLLGRCDPAEVSKRHYHDVDFQLVFMLKGWMKGEYNGRKITMRPGSCWIQPKKIKHTVLDYSKDCEMLEIVLPADFDTVEL